MPAPPPLTSLLANGSFGTAMFWLVSSALSAGALAGATALNATANGWIDVTATPLLNDGAVSASWMGLKPTWPLSFHRMDWIEASRNQPGLDAAPAVRSRLDPKAWFAPVESV